MKISIIIPTYNCGQYIKKAIDSVLDQPYQDKELIVIDGGSNDGTVDILKSYGEKIKWISEKDNGQADAINKGFKIATGEIATWLNADDYYEPNIFENISAEFKNSKEVVLVYGNCKTVSEKNIEINVPPKEITSRKMIRKGNFIYQPASFYRLETIKKVGYLDSSLNYWMEYDLFIKLLNNGKSSYIDRALANFTIRPDQKSNSKNSVAMNKELLQTSRKYGGSYFSKMFFSDLFLRLSLIFKKHA